ncbi:tRNA dihydrouridine(20/20a) synthase DusA [Marinibactrum halimedae]|uniref:tRNA-dihydrouridine(20/20a) synthase n=1 Tax=Marinibactrum halimedae TaxID=1444977 RepID=A0AA37TCF3_9GAMM|nr:tRNA dihydrouridine(20/20a) synthase DusA [Marinibactrum halimedae]MCD9460774.1 tRNA dihydrouridine(20/20a) synthase DusA [Marinibactrum halimedae]GLS26652.1 tRNA-dihydrouridine(20/20a) synthase [Marinibactrum halimedae]
MTDLKEKKLDRRFCVAPMMDWSDKHCRYLWRLISQHALLYTEMVTTGAILQGDRERFLNFNEEEHPLALQLGGSNPADLAQCAKIAERWGYDEINLNCGCPSDRVQNGMIGAILMAHPQLVSDCIRAMQDTVSIPVTVKHRIGIDDMDDYEGLVSFVETVAQTGCKTFIVHARKAWLQGLSPKENREIPPLQYERVYQLKKEFPQLEIIINGGLTTMSTCAEQLEYVDGVMVGREAYSNPYALASVDAQLYQTQTTPPSRNAVFQHYMAYMTREHAKGTKLHHMSKHVLGLFQGQPGARQFRRHISENIHKPSASLDTLWQAFELVASSTVAKEC